jgi:putative ABC transport system permease protein
VSNKPPQIEQSTSSSANTQLVPVPGEQITSLQNVLAELRLHRRRRGSELEASMGSALEALWANRGRSFLTALGIFIGVAAVIAALILTQGVNTYVNNQLAQLGSAIIISSSNANKGTISEGATPPSTLTQRDAQSLVGIPHLVSVSPIITVNSQTVFRNQNWTTQIEGVSVNYLTIQNLKMAQGTWFSSSDEETTASVAVVGDTVMHNLFDASGVNPIGQSIRIGNAIFRVEGTLQPQGGSFSQDDVIYVPFETAQIRLKNLPTVDQIQAQADATDNVSQTAQAITTILRRNHHILPGATDDFTVMTFTQFLQRAGAGTQILTALLVGIAAISLTVGGVGIMNIMLVSVVERTWEIGIRMSLGARRRDIRSQFLIEAILLCLIGGIVGLLLGLLIGGAVTRASQLPFVVTPITLLLPFAVSTGIAIAFGLYPAIRASRLDPIEALRTEE